MYNLRVKVSTKAQLEKLVEYMLCNKEFAKGMICKASETGKEKWKTLTNSLNSLGPPVRDEEGWSKVSIDY